MTNLQTLITNITNNIKQIQAECIKRGLPISVSITHYPLSNTIHFIGADTMQSEGYFYSIETGLTALFNTPTLEERKAEINAQLINNQKIIEETFSDD